MTTSLLVLLSQAERPATAMPSPLAASTAVKPDGALRPGAYAFLGLGVDNAR